MRSALIILLTASNSWGGDLFLNVAEMCMASERGMERL